MFEFSVINLVLAGATALQNQPGRLKILEMPTENAITFFSYISHKIRVIFFQTIYGPRESNLLRKNIQKLTDKPSKSTV